MKYCSSCHTFKPPFVKYANRKLSDGTYKQYYHCNNCNSKRAKAYRATPNGKVSVYKSVRKYVKNNPIRRAAWSKAQSIGMQACEVCNAFPADRHHPNPLMQTYIKFLCPYHHRQAHATLI